MVERDLAPGEWSVLALLADAPAHGWALAKEMSRTGEIGRVWSMGRPLVYRALELLESRGLIEAGRQRARRARARIGRSSSDRTRPRGARALARRAGRPRPRRPLAPAAEARADRARGPRPSRPLLEAQRELTVPAVAVLESRLRERRHRAGLRPVPARDDARRDLASSTGCSTESPAPGLNARRQLTFRAATAHPYRRGVERSPSTHAIVISLPGRGADGVRDGERPGLRLRRHRDGDLRQSTRP